MAGAKEVRKTGRPILEIPTGLLLNFVVNWVKETIRMTSRVYLAQVVHLVSWMTRGLKDVCRHGHEHSVLRLRSWNQ